MVNYYKERAGIIEFIETRIKNCEEQDVILLCREIEKKWGFPDKFTLNQLKKFEIEGLLEFSKTGDSVISCWVKRKKESKLKEEERIKQALISDELNEKDLEGNDDDVIKI